MSEIAVETQGLSVRIAGSAAQSTRLSGASVQVLTDVDLALRSGSVTALVGESGCGKSMIAAAVTGLLPPGAFVDGKIRIGGEQLVPRSARWRELRGRTVGLVPQSPVTSFTPVRTVGSQLREIVDELEADREPDELCAAVGLAADVLQRYPHELSGGMAQRAAIAAALAGRPPVIVADEPTSALDVSLADGVWRLLADAARAGTAVLVITHDIDALRRAGNCDEIAVMRDGGIVLHGSAADVMATDDPYVAEFFSEVV